jgi:hypothetical protein
VRFARPHVRFARPHVRFARPHVRFARPHVRFAHSLVLRTFTCASLNELPLQMALLQINNAIFQGIKNFAYRPILSSLSGF